MKKSSILIIALLLSSTTLLAQWGNKKIKGNGKMKTETRTTSDYDGVSCAGSFDYVLVSGAEGKITLEGEENLLEHIIVEIKGSNLVVKTENNVYLKPSNDRPIVVTIPFKDIDKVSLAGSGDLYNKDIINAGDFKASLAGSGDMILNVNASNVKASLAGSGDLSLKGKTGDLDVSLAGSGDIHAFDLDASNVEAAVAGSGDIDIVCNGTLTARVSGSGDITYKGKPTKEDTKVSGSGKISMNN